VEVMMKVMVITVAMVVAEILGMTVVVITEVDHHQVDNDRGNIGGGLEVTITQFTVDCGGRSDYPPGTYGHRYCSNTGSDGGGYGNYVINTTGRSYGKNSDSSGGNDGNNFNATAWQSH
jgi:hypothetical protein